MTTQDYATHRPIGSQLKEGDCISLTAYYKVKEHRISENKDPVVIVQSVKDPNEYIQISENLIDKDFYSADYYAEEVSLPITELEQVFLSAGSDIFSVSFNKQDESERILRGYSTGKIVLAKAQVIDAEVNEFRQVDLREINWLVLRGVKYTLKYKKSKAKTK